MAGGSHDMMNMQVLRANCGAKLEQSPSRSAIHTLLVREHCNCTKAGMESAAETRWQPEQVQSGRHRQVRTRSMTGAYAVSASQEERDGLVKEAVEVVKVAQHRRPQRQVRAVVHHLEADVRHVEPVVRQNLPERRSGTSEMDTCQHRHRRHAPRLPGARKRLQLRSNAVGEIIVRLVDLHRQSQCWNEVHTSTRRATANKRASDAAVP